jgi:transcription initiation factor TFIIIB Brf1 subunit/transcription initiation factor TFIIB
MNSQICKNCNSQDIIYSVDDVICSNCGIILHEYFTTSSYYSNQTNGDSHSGNNGNKENHYRGEKYGSFSSRIQKLQNWCRWTNDEKNQYKLSNYTKSLCNKLNISDFVIQSICNTVNIVMNAIKQYNGTKRARVKDGIILVCIQYVLNEYSQSSDRYSDYSYGKTAVSMAKELNLEIKYITRAEKLILELLNNHKLNLNENIIHSTKTPYNFINDVVNKYNIKISENILSQVCDLIKICDDNDLLLDHTPLSIGVCCFYYVLKSNNISVDLKLFSDLYNLSIVTVSKTYNKLIGFSNIIENSFKKSI